MSSGHDELRAELRALCERARAAGDEAVAALAAEWFAITAAAVPIDEASDGDAWHGMVGRSPAIVGMRDMIRRFAAAAVPVLIRGESGTGKDLVARIIHDIGPRKNAPMVAENCAAIPETLLESVLFGHARGAFTGAVRDHGGHFVAAHKGTLFLDEIGDTPLAMQAKLLRALQEGEVRAVGSEKTRKVDVRVIAATNRDLEELVRQGKFREDLFFRLNVLQLTLPPLRERGEDVVLLARRILAQSAARNGRVLTLSPDAERAMAAYRWPGNVRQLQNELQRVSALADGPVVGVADLSPELRVER